MRAWLAPGLNAEALRIVSESLVVRWWGIGGLVACAPVVIACVVACADECDLPVHAFVEAFAEVWFAGTDLA